MNVYDNKQHTMKTILVDAINTFVDKDLGIDLDMNLLLDTYPEKKLIVTNANDEQMVQFRLDQMPYEVFTLKHNPDKPDPAYFSTLLKKYNYKASDVVYFEHNAEAVESARSIGISTYHYNPEQHDLLALKTFLDVELGKS